MNPLNQPIRRAFSLIEVLTVIAIIGILVALLVPAVQKVRAIAATASCAVNLKQIGLAMHQYHDIYNHFPTKASPRPDTLKVPPSWAFEILPYIEQDSLFRQGMQVLNPLVEWADVSNVAATIVPTFICPADTQPSGGFQFVSDERNTSTWARTSYLGVMGNKAFDPDLQKFDGVFPWFGTGNSLDSFGQPGFGSSHPVVRIADISDGVSYTVMIGERPASKTWTYAGDWGFFGIWFADAIDQTRLLAVNVGGQATNLGPGHGYGAGGTDCPPLMYFSEGNLDSFCHVPHFWSFHDGGGNWLFCDGTVRFMSYSAGTSVIPAMATIAGGEEVPPFE